MSTPQGEKRRSVCLPPNATRAPQLGEGQDSKTTTTSTVNIEEACEGSFLSSKSQEDLDSNGHLTPQRDGLAMGRASSISSGDAKLSYLVPHPAYNRVSQSPSPAHTSTSPSYPSGDHEGRRLSSDIEAVLQELANTGKNTTCFVDDVVPPERLLQSPARGGRIQQREHQQRLLASAAESGANSRRTLPAAAETVSEPCDAHVPPQLDTTTGPVRVVQSAQRVTDLHKPRVVRH